MNPAVIDPSHMPKNNLHTKRPAKLVHAAWQVSAIAQTRMLRLGAGSAVGTGIGSWMRDSPHPSSDGESLEG